MVDLHQIGIVFGSLTPPEALPSGARLAEELGFGELWFSEDCFFTGGMSGLTQLLSSTSSIPAGLGLASVMTRHPAVLAMELAGIARLHPGRTRAAIGLGNRHWLEQMGLLPDRPLTTVAETYDAVGRLLRGDAVDTPTSQHHFDDIALAFPPQSPPELWIGAVNERALRLAGARADGVLLSVLASPTYVRWAKRVIASGAQEAGRPVPRVTAFALAAVDDEERRAVDAVRDAVGFFVGAEAHTALVTRSSLASEIAERRATGGAYAVPDHWVRDLAVAGDPDTVTERIGALLDAGADSVGLWLFPPERLSVTMRQLSDSLAGPAVAEG
ncbi:alkanesulfonate monooxygenase SsuD/methylene tetrahydromethanopterin reductase-like flavin-dependent oxidoreductase (luciferase family) [Nocardioides thalensis]|uniref:Alkanesulfonate monooxygenase SsuD/methylene tetrahydromethanopterin reductase-like flavin-dependent oxidoreductase (Luciferase family) n=1 Tax=Nocardioides thalensis TaxID=1914755 RepID=A0A853C0Y9_9ACTN|nr:LLM class flavin-dependent oxidoreductase [Nocardioides thalensis]NYJ00686.1 alkanesulfonate monooxygenase SsuD/methylene tetrahydromethanopterin reductase-like flavin-dependent oxidoreductase (luciferase family) [Nocardioides thalensis]